MSIILVFFFNDTATTEIYTLSLHDALPIFWYGGALGGAAAVILWAWRRNWLTLRMLDVASIPLAAGYAIGRIGDRKSTRLNSSHANISYAVFCLKKKKTQQRRALQHHNERS